MRFSSCKPISRSYENVSGSLSAQRKGKLVVFEIYTCCENHTCIIRKMVNVGSQLPFNLHNQVIPEPEAHDSVSRSPSRSDVSGYYYNSYNTDSRRQNHHNGRRHGRGFSLRSRSASPSHTPSAVITDQPKPNPILNVRWVGFIPKEVKNRGRQKERKSSQSGTSKSEEEEEDAVSRSVRRFLSCLALSADISIYFYRSPGRH